MQPAQRLRLPSPSRVNHSWHTEVPARAQPVTVALSGLRAGSASKPLQLFGRFRFVVGATPNLALNRTHCGVPPFGLQNRSPNAVTPQRSG